MRTHLESTRPAKILTGLGGHGIAALYPGRTSGPVVMVRCELDALPLPDGTGACHGCGHDGHMAIVAGLAARLGARPLERGSALLLFQPAEETGSGAAAVLADPEFRKVKPDFAVALHNLPGFPLGGVILKPGVFASASSGVTVRLTGLRSHAGEPQKGRSPALAVAQLIQAFSAVPQFNAGLFQAAKVTVIHAVLGARAFGTSPGEAVVMATLRAADPDVMGRLFKACEELASGTAAAFNLEMSFHREEEYPPVINDPICVNAVGKAAERLGMTVVNAGEPFPWSEDFGHFSGNFPGVLFGLGAGEEAAPLHHPDYAFPDELLPIGIELLLETVRQLCLDGKT